MACGIIFFQFIWSFFKLINGTNVSKIEGLLAYLHPMKLLAKTAFICNILFLVCILVQRTHDFIGQQDLTNITVILGWIIAPFLNFILHIVVIVRWLSKKQFHLSPWLLISNFLILLIQLYIYFFSTL